MPCQTVVTESISLKTFSVGVVRWENHSRKNNGNVIFPGVENAYYDILCIEEGTRLFSLETEWEQCNNTFFYMMTFSQFLFKMRLFEIG